MSNPDKCRPEIGPEEGNLGESVDQRVDVIPYGISDGEEAMPRRRRSRDEIVSLWQSLTPEQLSPSEGSIGPTGTPAQTLTAQHLEEMRDEAAVYEQARWSALAQLGRLASSR